MPVPGAAEALLTNRKFAIPTESRPLCSVSQTRQPLRLCSQVVLKRWDGARIWYPNEMINAAAVTNVTRTDTRVQSFRVSSLSALLKTCFFTTANGYSYWSLLSW